MRHRLSDTPKSDLRTFPDLCAGRLDQPGRPMMA
jgi:hypothetical protein